MTVVAHQKWWGWGVDGVTFDHTDKPKLAPFAMQRIGLDLNAPRTFKPLLSDLQVPAPRLDDALAAALRMAVGEDYVRTADLDRVVHTYGKGFVDLLRIRAGKLPRVPDVVVYPADEDEVRAVVDAVDRSDAVLIPFGGGSSITGALTPQPQENRMIISLDLGRMNRVLEIDDAARLARIQAGALGPDMERQLNAYGCTLGHQPDSFNHSTLGGWIATRSSGMQSDKYGDIAEIVRGLRVVQPHKVVVLRPLPSTSSGPSVREMIIGSEGRLGVITEAWVNVHEVPSNRKIIAYLFRSWDAGLAAMRQISLSDARPSVTRLSDADETAFSLSTQKGGKRISAVAQRALFEVLRSRGWNLDAMCLAFIGFEGGDARVKADKVVVRQILKQHGGFVLGNGPGVLYDQKKFDTPYIRDFLLDIGAIGDVSETAAPWSKLGQLYTNVRVAAHDAFDRVGERGFVMCHLSHSYHSGACLYFTFVMKLGQGSLDEQLIRYWEIKTSIQQAFIDSGGTLSHHHGVGTDHARWLPEDISEAGTDMVVALLRGVDPHRNLNPGTLLPADREW
jgi:alkyldihydroxyacetonephosphate synthase